MHGFSSADDARAKAFCPTPTSNGQKERCRVGVIAWSGPGRDCGRLVSLLLSLQSHARDLSISASRTQARPKFVFWNTNDQIRQLETS
jgi:hypothetical protein